MAYTRKTRDTFEVLTKTEEGWQVATVEDSLEKARVRSREIRESDEHPIVRINKARQRLEEAQREMEESNKQERSSKQQDKRQGLYRLVFAETLADLLDNKRSQEHFLLVNDFDSIQKELFQAKSNMPNLFFRIEAIKPGSILQA